MEIVEIREIDCRSGEPTDIRFRHIPDNRYTARVTCRFYGSRPRHELLDEELKVLAGSDDESPERVLLGCRAVMVDGARVYECQFLYLSTSFFVVIKKTTRGYQVFLSSQELETRWNGEQDRGKTLGGVPTCAFCGQPMVSLYDLAVSVHRTATQLIRRYGQLRTPSGQPFAAGWTERDEPKKAEINPALPLGEVDGCEIWVDAEWAGYVSAIERLTRRVPLAEALASALA